MPSGSNWADNPSSWFGSRARRGRGVKQEVGIQHRLDRDLGYRYNTPWSSSLVFVHLYSGRRRDGDLEYWLHCLGDASGISVVVFSFDLAIDPKLNLLDNDLFSQIR